MASFFYSQVIPDSFPKLKPSILKSFLLTALVATVGLTACSSNKHIKQRSVEKHARFVSDSSYGANPYLEDGPEVIELDMKKSNINLKYRLNKHSMKDTFNSIMDSLLSQNTFDIEEYNLGVKLSKNKAADIEFEGKKVLINFPLIIKAEKETILQKLLIEGEIHVAAICSIEIDGNWELVTDTELVDYFWIEKPTVKMGILSLPVEKIMNRAIEKAKHKVVDQIDHTIREKMALRSQIVSVMELVRKPIIIDGSEDLGLSIAIDDFSMSGVNNQFEWTEGIISVSGMGQIANIDANHNSSEKLPTFSWLDAAYDHDTSDIYFNIDVELDLLNKLAKEKFVGKRFSENGKEITIMNIEIKGLEDKLGVVADVEGSYNGQIFLSAIPEYNPESRKFVSKDIEINLLTKNVLHKGLAWMLKGRIKSELDKTLQFSLDDILKPMRSELAKQIEEINSSGEIELKAMVQDLGIEEFKFSKERIHATIHLPMILELNVLDFNMVSKPTASID